MENILEYRTGLIDRISFFIGDPLITVIYNEESALDMTCDKFHAIYFGNVCRYMKCLRFRKNELKNILLQLIPYTQHVCVADYHSFVEEDFEIRKLIATALRVKLLFNEKPLLDMFMKGLRFHLTSLEDSSYTLFSYLEDEVQRYHFITEVVESKQESYYVLFVGEHSTLYEVDEENVYTKVFAMPLGSKLALDFLQELYSKECNEQNALSFFHRAAAVSDSSIIDCFDCGCPEPSPYYNEAAYAPGMSKLRDYMKKIKDREDLLGLASIVLQHIGEMIAWEVREKIELKKKCFVAGPFAYNASVRNGISVEFRAGQYSFPFEERPEANFIRNDFILALGFHINGLDPFWLDHCYEEVILSTTCINEELSDTMKFATLEFRAVPQTCRLVYNQLLRDTNLPNKRMRLYVDNPLNKIEPYDIGLHKYARDHWFDVLTNSMDDIWKRISLHYANDETAKPRFKSMSQNLINKMKIWIEEPYAFGTCTVYKILNMREQALIRYNFYDLFRDEKARENDKSLEELPHQLHRIDMIESSHERLREAMIGVYAGNVFDWGSPKVANMLESDGGLEFGRAMQLVRTHFPHREFEHFYSLLRMNTFQTVRIYVDNAGADFILGVMPFVRELLKWGLKVTIEANILPALNDMTYIMLQNLIVRIGDIDPFIKSSALGNLKLSASGQSGPCLDMRFAGYGRNFNHVISNYSPTVNTFPDLIIFEGMGRAILSNLKTDFRVHTLRLATVKSEWIAMLTNTNMYHNIFDLRSPVFKDDYYYLPSRDTDALSYTVQVKVEPE